MVFVVGGHGVTKVWLGIGPQVAAVATCESYRYRVLIVSSCIFVRLKSEAHHGPEHNGRATPAVAHPDR